jgi:hypothetical protein
MTTASTDKTTKKRRSPTSAADAKRFAEEPDATENADATEAPAAEDDVMQLEVGKGYELSADGVRELTEEETAALHAAQPCDLAPVAEAAPVVCPKCSEPHPGAEAHHTNLMCPSCQHVWKREAQVAAPTSFAADLEAAQAGDAAATPEPDANRVEVETVEDVIDVKLTDADLADIARANAADDQEKTQRQKTVDDLKTELKEEKEAIEALVARMHDRNNAVLKGHQARKAHWTLETCFATNTARYIDPRNGRVVHERALRVDERQISLPIDAKPKSDDGQLSLGDVEPTDMTNPAALLLAAKQGEQDPADAPLDNEPSSSDLGDDDDSDDDQGGDDEDSE